MPAEIIDGVAIARVIREEAARDTAALITRGVRPGLAVVLVGEDPASTVYVRAKGKACDEARLHSSTIQLPASTSQAELENVVNVLNDDPMIHGILVQMPLPSHLDADAVIRTINPRKDVDGFHPVNVGKLLVGEKDGFVPCTPAGIIELLRRSDINTRGAECVVVGRSNIVGKPMAQLLLGENCTVTITHSRTRAIQDVVRRAAIVVAAVGRPGMIRGDWIKPGATVIDVGINRLPTDDGKGRLVGDVAFDEAAAVAGAITPVPGGVGPMTIAMLMRNTLVAAHRRAGFADPEGL